MQSSPIVTRRGAQKAKIQTRGMVRQEEARKPSAALLEAKKKAREKLNTSAKRPSAEGILIRDIYQSVSCFCFVFGISSNFERLIA